MKFVAPQYKLGAFTCPHCNVYSRHTWQDELGYLYELPPQFESHLLKGLSTNIGKGHENIQGLKSAKCDCCQQYTFWYEKKMVYPDNSIAPLPSPDLPEDIQIDYMEARSIVSKSPRGAAALLRLCIQKLCKHLGESGDNLNNDIANLVQKGLNPQIQKSLDIVRVIGNNAVHPGHIDFNDNHDNTLTLFKLINLIVDELISTPKEVEELYSTLPQSALKAIEKRDVKH